MPTTNRRNSQDTSMHSRADLALGSKSRAKALNEHIRHVKEICRSGYTTSYPYLVRPVLYKLFEPLFKSYYRKEAKRCAATIDWKGIYCGETPGLVSVILPVYDQSDLLEESINSVLSQDYDDLELIIVNDGSTDGVERILDQYIADPRILILEQENSKLPSALNTGFSHARGEFLTWTSADNRMLPHQVADQVRFLRKNPYVHLTYCNYELIDEQGNPIGSEMSSGFRTVNTDRDIGSLKYTYNFINACFMYRKYVARIIGNYDPHMYGSEDYDYWLRINDHFCIEHIGHERPCYQYRLHSNTILGREGNGTVGQQIQKTQELDSDRRAFFTRPMWLYVPQHVRVKEQSLRPFKKEQALHMLRFDDLGTLKRLLFYKANAEKKVLFVTTRELSEPGFLSFMEARKHREPLFSFYVADPTAPSWDSSTFQLFDWIVAADEGVYNSLASTYAHKLIGLSPWQEYLSLCAVIADHRLWYDRLGRKAPFAVPSHTRYGNASSSLG